MPIRNVLVSHARSHVEHDNSTLTIDVIAWSSRIKPFRFGSWIRCRTDYILTVSQSSKFLLSGSVPNVENEGPSVGVE